MKKLFFLLMVVVAMVACSDDSSTEGGGNNGGNNGGGQTTQASLTVSPTNVDFSTDGGTSKVTITSSAAWTAEFVNDRADDWCSIDSTSGSAGTSTLTITATANDTPDDRTASIVVKAGTLSKTINVSQKQKDALTVTSSKFEVDAEGGEVVVEVKANIDFEYAIDDAAKDWISYEGTRAIQTSTLVFKVAKNDDTEKREGKITIKSGEFSEEVTVYQAGEEPSIVISQNEYTVSSDGETIAVEVSSNVDVAVEIPEDVDWIKESTTRATSTNTYYFDITKNEDYDQRSAEIRFTNKENNLSEVITITQTQKNAIVVANDTYTVDGAGGTIEIAVGHNVDFDVVISADWITLQTTRAYETETLVFAIAENPSEESREGTITFTSADGTLKQVVTVKQSVIIAANQIAVTLTSSSYLNDLHALVAYRFDTNVTSISHIGGNTYVITLKEECLEIPNLAFVSATVVNIDWLEHITLGDGITSIGALAFSGCEALKSVTIPDSVTSIGGRAFNECINLYAFYGKYASADNRCLVVEGKLNSFAPAGLTSYTIPGDVTSIGDGAFYDCDVLDSITIPDSVTSIGEVAFYDCEALKSVTIPDSVTSIGLRAFLGCNALESITIPDSVTSIDYEVFCGCYALESITIGNGVTSIGEGAFSYCKALESVIIPDSVTSIGESAFYYCNALESVIIPDSVTSIGIKAFEECIALKSVTIGNGVTSIGLRAFYNCKALKSVTIPDSVTSIGDSAFENCKALKSVTIGNGVTSIGGRAFDCAALETVYCKPIIPPTLGANVFYWTQSSSQGKTMIYVPHEALADYQSNHYWKEYNLAGYYF